MDPQQFGDSYDFVKRDLIHWLASAEEWATHPMYFGPKRGFIAKHAEFLGIALAAGDTIRRNLVSTVGSDCPHHLLLDPNTGLRAGHEGPTDSLWDHVTIEEI